MKIVKYILRCLLYFLSSAHGGDMEAQPPDGIVGFATLATIWLLFLLAYEILHKKTTLDHDTKVLISIGITIALVGIIFAVLIVVEKIFGL